MSYYELFGSLYGDSLIQLNVKYGKFWLRMLESDGLSHCATSCFKGLILKDRIK